MPCFKFLGICLAIILIPALTTGWAANSAKPVIVSTNGAMGFKSVQQAVDALPEDGGVIKILSGIYRELVTVSKPHVRMEGDKKDPSKVVIVFNNSHGTVGGTLKSATVSVWGDDFFAEGITFANDFSVNRPLAPEGAQAVALLVKGDRGVFRNVRMIGAQDTLYAGSKSCASEDGPCVPARQYFSDCYIEGNVDFIFGDAQAYFENCQIHATSHETVFLTAQSKHYPEEASGYVFERCAITAAPGAEHVFLGRPWRSFSTVVFLNANLQAPIEPAGWREWRVGDSESLKTVFYAEFESKGQGADISHRDLHSKQLTEDEAQKFSVKTFLSGADHWNPAGIQ